MILDGVTSSKGLNKKDPTWNYNYLKAPKNIKDFYCTIKKQERKLNIIKINFKFIYFKIIEFLCNRGN